MVKKICKKLISFLAQLEEYYKPKKDICWHCQADMADEPCTCPKPLEPIDEKTEKGCKYAAISHGIDIRGEVTEISVHCEMDSENDHKEYIPKKEE